MNSNVTQNNSDDFPTSAKIWKLNTDDEEFTTYYFPEEDELTHLKDIFSIPVRDKLLGKWDPLVILAKEVRQSPDFFLLEDEFICLSSRAVDMLPRSFSSYPNLELLPLLNDEDQLFLLHLLPEQENILDLDNAIVNRLPATNQILRVIYYAFEPEKIRDKFLFKIEGLSYGIFATESFKRWYHEAGLAGLEFSDDELIWSTESVFD